MSGALEDGPPRAARSPVALKSLPPGATGDVRAPARGPAHAMPAESDARRERSQKAEEFLVLNEKVRHEEATPAERERWLRLRDDLLGAGGPAPPSPDTGERTR
ncbi:MAG: hypothetical protein HYZ28_20990 [Myxococcales bacterium]|nr:hypothetical protein [Myxococcales bacterium]